MYAARFWQQDVDLIVKRCRNMLRALFRECPHNLTLKTKKHGKSSIPAGSPAHQIIDSSILVLLTVLPRIVSADFLEAEFLVRTSAKCLSCPMEVYEVDWDGGVVVCQWMSILDANDGCHYVISEFRSFSAEGVSLKV